MLHKKFKQVNDNYVDGLDCSVEPSMTQQQFKEECDINNILKSYATTGALPGMIKEDPQYGDFSDVPSYQEALHIVSHAHEQFSNLDAHIRARFNNDPATFLDFVTDSRNAKELVTLGLASERDLPPQESLPKKKSAGSKDPVEPAAGKGPDA